MDIDDSGRSGEFSGGGGGRPATGLPAEVLVVAPGVKDRVLLERVLEICRFTRTPTGWSGGRSGWDVLPGQMAYSVGAPALKLKGLGIAPATGEVARPPRASAYDRSPGLPPDPHFGVRADLEFDLVASPPAPLGGLTLTGARREFRCATELAAAAVPAVRPVCVVRRPGTSFPAPQGDQALGVSVTASPVASPLRCSILLAPPWVERSEALAEVDRLTAALGEPTASPVGAYVRLDLLRECYRRFGATLRSFSVAGWYRYSGHPDNFVVDDHGRAVLVDLDSCRPLAELPAAAAALEEVRDGMSGLYNLACSFFSQHALDLVSDEDLVAHEPFSGFLDGWDPGSAGRNAGIGRSVAEYVVTSRRQLRHFGSFLRSGTTEGEHLYRFVRHDRDLTFAWLFRVAFLRRWRRPGLLELPFGPSALDERLLRFVGRDRWVRLEQLPTG